MAFSLESVLKDIDDSTAGLKTAASEETNDVSADLEEVLDDVEAPKPPKAKSVTPKVAATSDDDILSVLDAAIGEVEKTASEQEQPISEIMKLAQDLADQDFEFLTMKAASIGNAIADAVVTRLQAYEKAASDVQTAQTAGIFTNVSNGMQKAASAGYNEARDVLEKIATDTFMSGYEKTAALLITDDVYAEGYQKTAALIMGHNGGE